ncbi:MAG: NAD(+)/NADH kinase [Legionella sp.]|nr:NAD(+)/NADH kinase [Legionella sp.]
MNHLGIVINKKARNSTTFNTYLESFTKAGIQYEVYPCEPDELETQVKKCVKKHPIILIGGGDGTVRTAAQHCANTSTILGVIPLGTLNHFAKESGSPFDAEELVKAIIEKKTNKIDVAEVNGFIFVNNASLGFYPSFTRKRDKYMKFYNKWISYIPSFIETLKSHKTFDIHLKNETIDYSLKTSFLMISNNLYSYTFPLTFERKSFKESLLGIYFYKHGKIRLSDILGYFFRRKNKFVLKHSSLPIEVHIAGVEKITISLDGENIPTQTPLKYKILPKALTVLKGKA